MLAPYYEDGQIRGYTIKDKKNPKGKYTLSTKKERAEENRQYLIDNPSRLSYYRKNEYAKGGDIMEDLYSRQEEEEKGKTFEKYKVLVLGAKNTRWYACRRLCIC